MGIGAAQRIKTAAGLGGSMSPIRKSFADPRINVYKAVDKVDPMVKTIKELSKIKDQYRQTSNVRSGSGFLSPAEQAAEYNRDDPTKTPLGDYQKNTLNKLENANKRTSPSRTIQ